MKMKSGNRETLLEKWQVKEHPVRVLRKSSQKDAESDEMGANMRAFQFLSVMQI